MDEIEAEAAMEAEDVEWPISGHITTVAEALAASIAAASGTTLPEVEEAVAAPWWNDHKNLAALAQYMVDHEDWSHADVFQIIEKPWHFDAEWDRMAVYADAERMALEDLKEIGKPIAYEDQDYDD